MTAENANSSISAFGLPVSILPQLEQSKKLAETSAKYRSDLLSFAAKRSRPNLSSIQSLAHCDDTSDFFKANSNFSRRLVGLFKRIAENIGDSSKGCCSKH